MFDVFTEEIEVQIKKGISNLYWYLGDLKKAWLRSGVDERIVERLFSLRHDDKSKLSKRQLMDKLYEELRKSKQSAIKNSNYRCNKTNIKT